MLLLYSRGNNVVVVVNVVVVRKRSMFVVVVVIVTQAAESVGRERVWLYVHSFVRSLNYTVVVTFLLLSTYWNGKNSTM